ncbi:MAG TPA: carboxypeptidase-like regulatory domain-containing protein [Prolixibacteraceae bacterium]|nr:carboxypeptidase-like regulatory domain-containing protein [Prolixibacteraceae bacterium]
MIFKTNLYETCIDFFTIHRPVIFICLCRESSIYRINGQVVEMKNGNGIPFATILIENDSIPLKKVMATDASGNFTLKVNQPNNYQLTIHRLAIKS